MPSRNDHTDMINAAIRRATEMVVLSIRRFLEDNPNPVGFVDRRPPRLTQAELKRLLGRR